MILGMRVVWAIPIIVSIVIFALVLSQNTEALKSEGNSLTEVSSKKVCGTSLCDEPMSIAEKIRLYLQKLSGSESTVLQQAIDPRLMLKEPFKVKPGAIPSREAPSIKQFDQSKMGEFIPIPKAPAKSSPDLPIPRAPTKNPTGIPIPDLTPSSFCDELPDPQGPVTFITFSSGNELGVYDSPQNQRILFGGGMFIGVGSASKLYEHSQVVIPISGTLKNLFVNFAGKAGGNVDGLWVHTYKNGVRESLSCNIPLGGSTCSDTTNCVSLSPGDTFGIRAGPIVKDDTYQAAYFGSYYKSEPLAISASVSLQ